MRVTPALIIVFAITLFIMFFNLGSLPLLDPDEPVYAETPKEMFIFNEFLSPRIYGEYWYDKPPMYYWLVAGSYKLFGINEFAARFPSALLGVACVGVICQLGSKLFNERTGILSALILTTSIEFFYLGKAAVTDMTLVFCLTTALSAFLQKKYYWFYIFAGLATLTKGPIGILFPGGIIFFYLLISRNFSEIKNMRIPFGIILFSIVALPWYIMMYNIHGSAFIDTFLGFHNITRFTSPEHPEGILWYYYVPVLILGFFPWTAILLQSVWTSLTKSRREFSPLLFLNIWAWFIFIFFTISQTKLVSYILPMYPPLALIAGWYMNRIFDYRYNSRYIGWGIGILALSILFSAGLVWGIKFMPELSLGVYWTVVIFTLMSVISACFLWKKRQHWTFVVQIIAMLFFVVVLMAILFPAAAPAFTANHIAKQFVAVYDNSTPVYVIKFLHPGFTYYTGIYGTELKSDKELITVLNENKSAYYIVRKSEYNRLPENLRAQITVLATENNNMLLRSK